MQLMNVSAELAVCHSAPQFWGLRAAPNRTACPPDGRPREPVACRDRTPSDVHARRSVRCGTNGCGTLVRPPARPPTARR
jgi:hypothetical protein